ncbi:MAG: hypothetical protein ACON38_16190 [Akkermansiaceae bacterium]
MAENPYAAPEAEDLLAEDTHEVVVRKSHLGHETSIKSIAYLDYLAVLVFIAGILDSRLRTSFANSAEEIVYFSSLVLIPVLLIWAGRSIRKLKTSGRILNVILFGISLIGFPIGTLIGVYALYLLLGPKSWTVFSADYREIITATPQIKYRTSRISWILLAALLFVLAFVVGETIALR